MLPTADAAPAANELYGTDYYRVNLIIFSQQPRGSAVEESIYSAELLADDPETLLRFANVDYGPPAWFVRPETPEAASVVVFEDLDDSVDPDDEAVEGALNETRSQPLAAEGSPGDLVDASPADEPAAPRRAVADPAGQPLSPAQRRALALAAAKAQLAAQIEQDRQALSERLLVFEDALAVPEDPRLEATEDQSARQVQTESGSREASPFPLRQTMELIERAPGLEVLFAGSWLTEPTARDALAPLWLQLPEVTEEAEAADALTVQSATIGQTPLARNEFGFPIEPLPEAPPRHRLEGTLAISKGRYLHAALQLVYDDPLAPLVIPEVAVQEASPTEPEAAPVAGQTTLSPESGDLRLPVGPTPLSTLPAAEPPLPVAAPASVPPLVHLAQRRRMKSGELHYVDHPRLGVLIRIDPIEVSEEATAALSQVEALERLQGQK